MSKKLYYLKTKHISLPKNAVSTIVKDTKKTKKSKIPPVSPSWRSVQDIHVVMPSRLAKVRGKKVN